MRRVFKAVVFVFTLGFSVTASAANVTVKRDIEFADVNGHSLKLDLYLPEQQQPPLVVWIHGGGWRAGSKDRCPVDWLTDHGYAVASISYRLSNVATFPAQIHDCKAAIRWLKANATRYGYGIEHIAVSGGSAGGMLAALVGTSGDVAELEGDVGGNLEHSSRVDAVIDYYGPTDFVLRSKSHPERANPPDSTTALLLGGGADKNVEMAKFASPVTYVTADDPPLLILHGDKDNKVYLDQSQCIQKLYLEADLPVTLKVIEGLGHGGNGFFSGQNRDVVVAFLNEHLRAESGKSDSHLPRATPESQGVSSAKIREFIEAADQHIDTMHSFMMLRHGQVIAEGWWSPESPETPHILWSLSKSFTSTAVGLAVAEGKLNIDDKVVSFFPEDLPDHPSDKLQAMTVRDLLTMSSGHDPLPPLEKDGHWVRKFLETPVVNEPGSTFLYNTPATYMQSAIVQKVTGQTVLDYLTPRLFDPLGIQKPVWDESPQGISIGGYGLSLRTEDIAKFGQLLLQKGTWNGQQIVPADWIELATSKQIDNQDAPSGRNPDWRQGYGFQFWRCQHGAFRGDGKDGQFCIVLPEQDAVIAITAKTGNMQAQLDLVWQHLLPACEATPLPENQAENQKLTKAVSQLKRREPNPVKR